MIERTFGVAKKRFLLLAEMHSYTYRIQVKLVMAMLILHNFIRIHEWPATVIDYTDLSSVSTSNDADGGDGDSEVTGDYDDLKMRRV